MKRILIIILFVVTFVARADERATKRLEAVAKHYSEMGSYTIEFNLKAGGGVQKGVMMVSGSNTYMKIADTEIYVQDGLRYEVHNKTKEVIVDKADLYEKELFSPNSDLSKFSSEYNIEETDMGGAAAVRLTPKRSGETICVVLSADGLGVAKVLYTSGQDRAEVQVLRCQKGGVSLPQFSKKRYSGYETIDFR
jgi:hypothetical protein